MKSLFILIIVSAAIKLSVSFPTKKANSQDSEQNGKSIFIVPNHRTGKNLKEWAKAKNKGNPEEQGNYFEGDIIVVDEGRNGVKLATQKWPGGKIPYEVIGSFTSSELNMISDAVDEIQSKTCLKFFPRSIEKDYIAIDNDFSGCWSPVGKTGGKQIVNLQTPGCMVRTGTVIHEILHSIGFFHEQNRYDRDEHVKVNFEYVQTGREINFDKVSEDEITTFGVAYDIDSVLHYSPYAFSMTNMMTIESLFGESYNDRMGQRVKLSDGDIAKVKEMYCKN